MGERRSVFDTVTVLTVAGAAVIQAAQQALKDADQVKATYPMLDLSDGWNYVPLALVSVGLLSWVIKQAFRVGYVHAEKSANAPTLAPAPAPVLASKEPAAPEERVFLGAGVTPEFLCGLYEGRTALQGQRLAAPYLNKWMKVRGRFVDVDARYTRVSVDLVRDRPPSVQIWFEPSWLPRLEVLHEGEEVAIIGQLRSVDPGYISLEKCELVSLADAPGAYQMAPMPKPKARSRPRKAAPKKVP